jgi:hypothetical protein
MNPPNNQVRQLRAMLPPDATADERKDYERVCSFDTVLPNEHQVLRTLRCTQKPAATDMEPANAQWDTMRQQMANLIHVRLIFRGFIIRTHVEMV